MPALSVIVTDDHPLVRAGLCQLIGAQSDLRVVAQCRTGKETMAALQAQDCHILLLDLSLPDMSGLDVLKTTRAHYPAVARGGRYIGPELAAKLCLSVKTVSTYRSRVLDKLGMKTNAEITSYAIRNHIIQ